MKVFKCSECGRLYSCARNEGFNAQTWVWFEVISIEVFGIKVESKALAI